MTRRAFAALVACLPLSWQVTLGAVPSPTPTLHAERFMAAQYAWVHMTFDGHGTLLPFLRQHWNALSHGGLVNQPREVILGPSAYAQYVREIEPLRLEWTHRPAGAARLPYKGAPVYPLDTTWAQWHVGFLVPRGQVKR